ncbi:MAG: hypothetical protein LUC49_03100 [Prevotella sp.]|nr:hypothetical protein [Prevotella sp.]MCD8305635.1 hypothetical protein [Prevotella sp.]
MNLYIRYFDHEALVTTVDEALEFLASVPDIRVDADMEADVRAYAANDMCYPKRYKVRPRAYFILIKTTATTMEDFKQKKAVNSMQMLKASRPGSPATKLASLMETREGWYEGRLNFKRMVQKPQTGKYEYRDTAVVYQCKAVSGMDCYNRIVEHLKTKVNSRSQFPSAKGANFKFKYLGKCK